MDIPCAPMLTDITIGGRTIKAVAHPTKQASLYVFDRVTGRPIWPIEERPVPKGEVPGEWYSPTQPFPTKPPGYDRQGVSINDLIDFTPELREQAVKLVTRYKLGPLFEPPLVSKLEGPLAVLHLPSTSGGTNWPGGSYDPESHILYVFSQTNVTAIGLVPPPNPSVSEMAYIQGTALTGARLTGGSGSGPAVVEAPPRAASSDEGGGAVLTVQGLPLIKPPYGRISAIDLNNGAILWQIAHGETPDNIRNHPALKGLDIPRTGRAGIIGTLVTKSLLIAGEAGFFTTPNGQRGAMLRAYDKASGKEVGAVYMPAPQSGSPMTYMLNGRQYIVLAISGGAYSGELLAFRLPGS
jgi:quinoprotein glucose dehydrogenase